ncbi:phosphoglucosamine mutase [Rubrimonas cliftonensis]|uniref:Phosphoglucosamine mutase n=1 Tax=Rubrimonas cliftonensis TaxID=89524 RepID=A0A1H4CSR7_9RHOB|nr:phosphoglucosamine mutase [Rubrimonas cliftonensis]SEA63450.1 phosphoglucosamine mutase [Rubrimonas cliftonensis]
MSPRLFGTDGVRGPANVHPMTAEVALALGRAAARRFRREGGSGRVVIGKDTRLSGYMLESALQAGFTSGGMDVMLLGPVPTPAVGMLTRSMRADVGVMLSASHNPWADNGIKLFGPDGYKLSDAEEDAIEAEIAAPSPPTAPGWDLAGRVGRARRIDGGVARYIEVVKASFPKGLRLDGLKVAIDCANGAAYRAAPEALWELGAEVVRIGVSPNGLNINDGVGSTAPQACAAAVLEHGADIGVALDGDADRVMLIDETGRLVDGDQIMGLIAARWAEAGRLSGGALVATVMSNLGLERWLGAKGVGMIRTRVGDRYVVEAMRAQGCNVGGEQSGHVILSDFATTGDGLLAALQALAVIAETGRPASETLALFEPLPQKLVNVAAPREALERAPVRAAIAAAEAALDGHGRLLIRPSGTEPVIRVMAEAEDRAMVEETVGAVAAALSAG